MASASSVSYNDSYTHPTQGMGSQGGMSNMGGGGQQDENISGPQSSAQSVVSFIAGQFGRKHEDLKTMLDSSNNSQKLDAMKRIIGMMASGKDVSELFAAVVKNVVCKNIEVKKLVYVYLVRYAEEQQDLALLSIATFQRGLKDPNQLIRASALRVLSSIRVAVIVPIMMLSLKEAVTDMSPYVRKTAANAIPKLYSMDPEQKEHLVEIIEKLLQDKTTLVAGSTVIAFEEVCPERIDLIHKNFRKLCTMLIDIDEWGQVAVINMLLRYSRTQFLNPNKHQLAEINGKFYPSSEESEKSEDEDDGEEKKPSYSMDSDHRLLIQSCQPLLQSRNSAVIMAVAKLYHHLAPATEVGVVVKALIRLLKSHREVQTVVLSNVVTLSLQHKGLFDSYMNSFFVHTEDPTHVKRLKLEIMTNLANESSIPAILREFQTYISSSDKEFAACTIQSIGRCASNIPEVADTCLAGLIRMLSNRDENVVSESIIVIKKLLQMRNKDHSDVITHMAKLLDKVHVAMARASIIWLIGEYADKIPKIAPDVLRKMAKSFATEEGIVKLQVINLGAKLYITNSKQTRSLCQYVLQLAKYDQNYDIRDRARFIKFILFPANKTEGSNNLKKKAKKIFLVEKPAPVLQSLFKDRSQFQLGSLSHMIDAKASGYEELPDFPEQQPDPTVRNVELQPVYGNQLLLSKEKADDKQTKKSKGFYSSSEEESESESGSEDDKEEESGEEESGDESGEESEEGSEEKSESGEESEFEELSEQEEEEEEDQNEVAATKTTKQDEEDEEEEEEESSEESSDEDDESSEEETDDEEEEAEKPPPKAKSKSARPNQQSYDQLLDLDDFTSTGGTTIETNVVTPSLASDMQSLSLDPLAYSHSQLTLSPRDLPSYELLNKINGKGLTADYRFTRSPSVFSRSMVAVEISLSNKTKQDVKRIRVENKKLSPGVTMQEFNEIDCIASEGSLSVAIGIDFKDTLQPVAFDLCTEVDKFSVRINIPVGELMRGTSLNQNEFTTERKKLTGMTESKLPCDLASAASGGKKIADQVMATAALNQSPSPADDLNTHRFCGQLISSGLPVLVSIVEKEEESCVIVNCEKISVASLLAKQLKTNLQK